MSITVYLSDDKIVVHYNDMKIAFTHNTPTHPWASASWFSYMILIK